MLPTQNFILLLFNFGRQYQLCLTQSDTTPTHEKPQTKSKPECYERGSQPRISVLVSAFWTRRFISQLASGSVGESPTGAMVSVLVFLLSLGAATTAGRHRASVSPVDKVLELMQALYKQVRIVLDLLVWLRKQIHGHVSKKWKAVFKSCSTMINTRGQRSFWILISSSIITIDEEMQIDRNWVEQCRHTICATSRCKTRARPRQRHTRSLHASARIRRWSAPVALQVASFWPFWYGGSMDVFGRSKFKRRASERIGRWIMSNEFYAILDVLK